MLLLRSLKINSGKDLYVLVKLYLMLSTKTDRNDQLNHSMMMVANLSG